MADITIDPKDGRHGARASFSKMTEKQLIAIMNKLKEFERAILQEYEKRKKIDGGN